MKIRSVIILLTMALLLLSACASEQPMLYSEAFDGDGAREFAAEEAPMEPDAQSAGADDSLKQVNLQSQLGPERLIIRTGDMAVVVEDSDAAARDIAHLAEAKGGWLVESDLYESNGFKRGWLTVRVPADQFDVVVAEIKALALEVQSESTSSQDVTEEYVDLESRLTNLEATADRVRGFLDEAQTVEEALDVNQELSRLEGEIEVVKGRMKYLSQSAAFSTLTVNLIPDEPSQPVEIGGWRPEGVAKDAIEALVSTLQSLANVAIWGGIFCLPLALLVGVPLFFVGRYFYRRRQRGRETEVAAPSEVAEADLEAAESEETTE
jgi:hypothetical protein